MLISSPTVPPLSTAKSEPASPSRGCQFFGLLPRKCRSRFCNLVLRDETCPRLVLAAWLGL